MVRGLHDINLDRDAFDLLGPCCIATVVPAGAPVGWRVVRWIDKASSVREWIYYISNVPYVPCRRAPAKAHSHVLL
jgi:hypothetical protein